MSLEICDLSEKIQFLDKKLKKIIKDINFIELKHDFFMKDGIKISKNLPIPIYCKDMANELVKGRYKDFIPQKDIIDGMILIIGCDDYFKYNEYYIEILKNIENIDLYILNLAHKFMQNKEFIYSFACYKTFNKISDKHAESQFNLAQIMREMAKDARERNNDEEYKIYYDLSYHEYLNLIEKYPEFPYSYYHIGFFYSNEGKYADAINSWQKAYDSINDYDIKQEIKTLIEITNEKLSFESSKRLVLNGHIIEGLKNLIPLNEKYEDWSEVKYYTALAYRKIGNFHKAQILLYELMNKGEDFPEMYNELGICCFNLGDISKSIEYFERAVEKNCAPGFLCNLGIAYYKFGDIQKAKNYILKAYNMNPKDELTKKCFDWINTYI